MAPTWDSKAADEPGPGSQSSLRHANQGRILDALQTHGAVTQAELARRTSLAPSTVSGIVRDLVDAGVVHVDADHGGRRGRRVALSDSGRVLVAIDIGHAHVRVGLGTPSRQLLTSRWEPLEAGHTHTAVLARSDALLSELLTQRGLARSAILAGGLTIPAPLGLDGRVMGSRAILPGWADVDPRSEAEALFGFRIMVDNDANAGALAEQRWGAASGLPNVVYLKLGHGVGAGLVLGGEIFRGATGVSGEIGHTIVDENGAFCRCGNRGCLETTLNASYLLSLIQPTHPTITSIADLVASALDDDPACARLIGDAGRTAGVAAANLCNIINPDALVIGGSLAAAGDLLIDPLRESLQRYGLPNAVTNLRVAPAIFGADTHLIGAIGLAMTSAIAPPQRKFTVEG